MPINKRMDKEDVGGGVYIHIYVCMYIYIYVCVCVCVWMGVQWNYLAIK